MLKNTLPTFFCMHQDSDTLLSELYTFALAIRCENMDSAIGIDSTINHVKDAPSVWFRTLDLSDNQQEHTNKKTNNYNYLRIFYAYLIAAVTIAKAYNFDNSHFLIGIQHIQKIIQENFQANIDSEEKILRCLSEGKGDILEFMSTYYPSLDKKSLNNLLDHAKDWAMLTQPTPQVLTTIKLGEKFNFKSIVILDTPCTELTSEQKDYFLALESKKWFHELPAIQQKMLLHHKDRLLAEKNVIPSQLREYIPTNKNSFRQSIFIQDEKECKELNTYFHCGSMAYLSHGDPLVATDITKSNLLQQKLNSKTDAVVSICLNSTLADTIIQSYENYYGRDYTGDDNLIITLTSNAAAQLQNEDIYFSKICLNGFRSIEFNNYSGINKIIEIIKQNMVVLENEKTKKLREYITKLEYLQSQLAIWDTQVKGLDIIHCLTQLVSINNHLASTYPEKKLKTAAVWFGCASGENRTGITYFNTACQSIIDYFEQENKSTLSQQEKIEIYNVIASSEHVHIMTDLGGSLGTQGIRGKSSGTFKPDHPKDKLLTKTSDIKKLQPSDFEFNSALDNLQETLLTETEPAFSALKTFGLQLFNIEKKLITQCVFMSNVEKEIHKHSLWIMTNLIRNNKASLMLEDLNNIILKIKKIDASSIQLTELRDLLTKLSAAVSTLLIKQQVIKPVASSFSMFNPMNWYYTQPKPEIISSPQTNNKIT